MSNPVTAIPEVMRHADFGRPPISFAAACLGYPGQMRNDFQAYGSLSDRHALKYKVFTQEFESRGRLIHADLHSSISSSIIETIEQAPGCSMDELVWLALFQRITEDITCEPHRGPHHVAISAKRVSDHDWASSTSGRHWPVAALVWSLSRQRLWPLRGASPRLRRIWDGPLGAGFAPR